jgi:molecular chaperone GrpE
MQEDEIEFVPEDGEDLKVADPVKKIKDLKEKLKACEKEKQEYLDNWQRERADFLNYKKEEASRMERSAAFVREDFINELIPVLDSYDMAFANREAWEKVDKNWRTGVEYIHAQLIKVLSDFGAEEIPGKKGDIFDPNIHQSIETMLTEREEDDHRVDRIISKGYKIGDRVIRPARVAVLEYKK